MPPIYMLITSLKTSAEISAATNPWWVYHPTLGNYVELLTSPQYLTFFRNSALVSVIVVAITMLISVPAAFALSRMRFWGSATLATGVFLTYLIPETLLFIPLFKMFALFNEWTDIQLINRWWVLLLLYPTLTVPFCTWIMIGYFASIPKELDEAALIDGANYRQMLTRVFIPVALPGLIAATIFAFTVSLGAVPLSARLHHLGRPAGAAGRHHHLADQGRRVQLGSDHDRRAARRRAAADHLRLPDGLLHRRAHRRRHQGLEASGMAQVSLRKIVKRFDETEAVRGIDLDIADKEFVVLVGPVRLRQVDDAADDRRARGHHRRRDRDRRRGRQRRAAEGPRHRHGVPELRALPAHDGVREHVVRAAAQALSRRTRSGSRVQEAARILDITELLERKPRQLSGGQRQRVAMGRAIVRNPKVFLFDEPLSNLDAKLRVQMRTEIKRVHQKVRTTTVYVTHDQVEAMTLADRVVVMNRGRIEQIGTPNELYHAPRRGSSPASSARRR